VWSYAAKAYINKREIFQTEFFRITKLRSVTQIVRVEVFTAGTMKIAEF
jgi:hypothetical protein